MDLRSLQRPLKERYRSEPESARITLRASAGQGETPLDCPVEMSHGTLVSEAHPGVGGPGTAPCSGDVFLAALAGCAQVTAQMVAAAMGISVARIEVTAEGDLDLRGTLGLDRDAPVGFQAIRLRLDIDAPDATPTQIASLRRKTEQFCVVMQTLVNPPRITVEGD